jgi:hypothetical protein
MLAAGGGVAGLACCTTTGTELAGTLVTNNESIESAAGALASEGVVLLPALPASDEHAANKSIGSTFTVEVAKHRFGLRMLNSFAREPQQTLQRRCQHICLVRPPMLKLELLEPTAVAHNIYEQRRAVRKR